MWHSKVTITRHQWTVNVGCTHVEFFKAHRAAQDAYRAAHRLVPGDATPDDALLVTSDGKEITIFFAITEIGGA